MNQSQSKSSARGSFSYPFGQRRQSWAFLPGDDEIVALVLKRIPVKHLQITGGIVLAAASGEAVPTMVDVPAPAKAAVARRIDVPASAIQDGRSLVDIYWSANHCE